MQDWNDIYHRELIERPPAEDFLAGYFQYETPTLGAVAESTLLEPELPDIEE